MKRALKLTMALGLTAGLLLSAVTSASAAVTDVSANYQWKQLATGAGGWVTGMNIHKNGNVVYARTDVGGAYRLNDDKSSWKQIVTSDSMPDETYNSMSGVVSIVAVPSDENSAYMAYHGSVYKSSNKGDSWTKTNLSVADQANGEGRTWGERLAVDPNNAQIVYYGTIADGLQRTGDGGTSWSEVTSVTRSGESTYGTGNVMFDPSGGTVNVGGATRTKVIYATVYKKGVFRSGDGGQNWSKISGGTGPDDAGEYNHLDISGDGTVYVATGSLWKYKNGVWTNVTPNGGGFVDVAVSPTNANKVFGIIYNGDSWRSTSGGAAGSWTQQTKSRTATDVPWLAQTDESWMSVGNVVYDPLTDKLWFAEGIGVWTSTDINDNDLNWVSLNKGIEEMVTTDVVAPPGGKPVTSFWDRPVFYHNSLDQYPAQHGVTNRFNSGWDIDYSGGTPSFLVASIYDHRFCCEQDGLANQSGYSTDGGQTWHVFDSITNGTHPSTLKFGDIAVSANNTNNIVWMPTWNGAVHYTTNRGQTWTPVILPGTENSYDENGVYNGGSHFAYYLNRHVLAADQVAGNTFYLYHQEKGIYKSTNGGQTWTLVNTTVPKGWSVGYFHATLKSVPGKSGHLFLTFGHLDGQEYSVYHSTDGGTTWQELTSVKDATSFGFGKAATAGGYPALYLAGKVNGEYGIWRSPNEGVDWEKLATYPKGLYDTVTAIDGDKDVYGRVYVGYSGNSLVYGEPIGTDPGNGSSLANGTYKIINRNSGKSLDGGWSTSDGAAVNQWPFVANQSNQQWTLTKQADGTYQIVDVYNGKALDVGWSTATGEDVHQWAPVSGQSNQSFELIPVTGGYYKIKSKYSGQFMEVENASTADGAVVQMNTDNGLNNQLWQLTKLN